LRVIVSKNAGNTERMASVLSNMFDAVLYCRRTNGRIEFCCGRYALPSINSLADIFSDQNVEKILKRDLKAGFSGFERMRAVFGAGVMWADVAVSGDTDPDMLWVGITDVSQNHSELYRLRKAETLDGITGFYHRHKLQETLESFEGAQYMPLQMVMFDINGMRLINDVFGYQEGDKLLAKCSAIIKSAVPPRSVIFRMSGDEFLLVVPSCSDSERDEIIARVNEYCVHETDDMIPPDMSVGVACRKTVNSDLYSALRLVEDSLRKSQEKLAAKFRSNIINNLKVYLSSKNYESTKHIKRVKGLAMMLAASLTLDQKQMHTLSLAAELHDIGKVSVPEEILSKKTPLEAGEWALIRKHPDIGYRIAYALPDYSEAADVILHHHERWDGTGYPHGLKGEQIPLLARVLTIADVYDNLLHSPYKSQQLNERMIKRELLKSRGTQLDPKILDIFLKTLGL